MNNNSIQFLKEYHSSKISAEDLIALQDLCLIYNVKMSLLLVLLYRLNINTVQEDLESPIKHIDLKNIPDNFQQIVDEAKERRRSQGEEQMFKYVESLGVCVVANDRNAIRPKELDIYLPDFKVGIEYDGLYWHKESSLVSKTNKCDKKGIRLIRFYEDEWHHKKDICKSIIRDAVNLQPRVIKAKDCTLKRIQLETYMNFLKANHIHGFAYSPIMLGLYLRNELVFAIGVKQFQGQYILNRICHKVYTHVKGALKECLKELKYHYKIESLITYADRRTANIKDFEEIGFKLVTVTKPEYFYVVRGERIGVYDSDRLPDILNHYDPEKSDEENLHLNGYDRIFDCGKYLMKKEL